MEKIRSLKRSKKKVIEGNNHYISENLKGYSEFKNTVRYPKEVRPANKESIFREKREEKDILMDDIRNVDNLKSNFENKEESRINSIKLDFDLDLDLGLDKEEEEEIVLKPDKKKKILEIEKEKSEIKKEIKPPIQGIKSKETSKTPKTPEKNKLEKESKTEKIKPIGGRVKIPKKGKESKVPKLPKKGKENKAPKPLKLPKKERVGDKKSLLDKIKSLFKTNKAPKAPKKKLDSKSPKPPKIPKKQSSPKPPKIPKKQSSPKIPRKKTTEQKGVNKNENSINNLLNSETYGIGTPVINKNEKVNGGESDGK